MCACTGLFEAPISILHDVLHNITISSSQFIVFLAGQPLEEVYGGARTRWYCCGGLGWLISESPDAYRAPLGPASVRTFTNKPP